MLGHILLGVVALIGTGALVALVAGVIFLSNPENYR